MVDAVSLVLLELRERRRQLDAARQPGRRAVGRVEPIWVADVLSLPAQNWNWRRICIWNWCLSWLGGQQLLGAGQTTRMAARSRVLRHHVALARQRILCYHFLARPPLALVLVSVLVFVSVLIFTLTLSLRDLSG